MSNGLYNGNNELPKMTRREYLAEYHEITTYFDEEKVRIKKALPFCMALSVINVIIEIFVAIDLIPEILADVRFAYYHRKGAIWGAFVFPCILSFPLGSLIIRMKQIKAKEESRLADLENRKKICMDIGTYDVEK